MRIWIDAQLSPKVAAFIRANFNIEAVAVRDVGLRDASDEEIFVAAREANAVVMTKDADFRSLLAQLGPPPSVIWVRCGNSSNSVLCALLLRQLPSVLTKHEAGSEIEQIHDSIGA